MFKESFHEKITLVLSLLILNNYFLLSLNLTGFFLKVNLAIFLFFVLFFYLNNYKENFYLKFFFLILILISLGVPTSEWDPRSIWLFHAKRIFYDYSIYSVADNYFQLSHNDYPSLAPAFASSFALVLGKWNEVFPKTAFLFMFIPPLILVYVFLKDALYIIFLNIIFFIIGKYLFSGWMDGLLAVYFGISAFIFYVLFISEDNIHKENKILYLIALCFFTMLTLIKNEGIVLLLILFLSTFLILFYRDKVRNNLNKLIFLLLSFLPIILWKIFCYTKGINNDHVNTDILSNFLPRIFEIENYKMIFYFLFLNEKFLISFTFFLASFYLKRDNQIFIFIFTVAIIYAIILFIIFLSTPLDFYFQLNSTAARVIKSLSFLFAFFGLYNLRFYRVKSL